MRTVRPLFFMLLACMLPAMVFAQPGLRQRIQRIIDTSGAKVGVGVLGLDFKDSLVLNNDIHYPMQSVYKFPLAMAVLHEVDLGHLSLGQKIHITRQELDTNTWSPLALKYYGHDIDLPLYEVLKYTVSESDNNGCDILFRLIGGTSMVDSYVHSLGITGMAIKATEAEMHRHWNAQYTNWCQPSAMLQLLQKFYDGKVLSDHSRQYLMQFMTESNNSPARLKGLLPANIKVAHKTGTSGSNHRGLNGATNDIGIITLPDLRYAIVVYVSDYKGSVEKGERIIAEISRVVYEGFGG